MRIIERGSWPEQHMRRKAAAAPEGVSKSVAGSPPEPGDQPTPDPIEPDIGVQGSTVLWAVLGLILFFYHWGGVLVFVARFALAGTPYALVEARASAPAPLRGDDVVVVRRDATALQPGQIVWVDRDHGATALEQVFAVGDSILVTGRVQGAPADTLAERTPRDRVLGRAIQVILPLHRVRELP